MNKPYARELELRRLSTWGQQKPSDEIIALNNAVAGYFLLLKRKITPSQKTVAMARIASSQIMDLAEIIRRHGDTWDGLPVVEFDIKAELEKTS